MVVTVGGLYGHRHGEGVDGEYQLGDLFLRKSCSPSSRLQQPLILVEEKMY